jgi:hypothetical protein
MSRARPEIAVIPDRTDHLRADASASSFLMWSISQENDIMPSVRKPGPAAISESARSGL